MAESEQDVFAEMLGIRRPAPERGFAQAAPAVAEDSAEAEAATEPSELDVQRAVVEEMAAEKVELAEAHDAAIAARDAAQNACETVTVERDAARAEIEALKARVAELSVGVDPLKAEIEALKAMLAAAQDENAKLRVAFADAQHDIAELEEKVDRLFRVACHFRASLPPTSPAVLLAGNL